MGSLKTATATATAPGDVAVGPAIASATSSAIKSPQLSIDKVVDQPAFTAVDTILEYTITVANPGNITLSEVELTHVAPGTGAFDASDCASLPTALSPQDSFTCTVTYTTTQADLDAGGVTNSASATAVTPAAPTLGPLSASATSSAGQAAGILSLTKTVDQDTYDTVGTNSEYLVSVTNTGNVTLTGVTVTDSAPGPGAFDATECAAVPSTILPGASFDCHGDLPGHPVGSGCPEGHQHRHGFRDHTRLTGRWADHRDGDQQRRRHRRVGPGQGSGAEYLRRPRHGVGIHGDGDQHGQRRRSPTWM